MASRLESVDHIEAVERAVDYIDAHLDAPLSLEEVADKACFSRHHFNRLFAAVTGEPVHAFVRRLRLERAAYSLLKRPGLSITEIAAEAGYSPSNFASAFKSAFGKSASEFRFSPCPPPSGAYAEAMARIAEIRGGRARSDSVLGDMEGKVDIVDLPALALFRKRYRGPYLDLEAAWSAFCDFAEASYPDMADKEYVGISYDDPLVTSGEKLRYDLCLVVPARRGPGILRVPAGRYARYRFDAPLAELVHVFYDLVALWLPRLGLVIGEGPCLEVYQGGLDAEGRIAVDVCVPLRP